MESKLLKFSLVCVTGAMILAANPNKAMAFEESVAGYPYDKDKISTNVSSSSDININSLSEDDIPIPGFNNIAIADVKDNLNIRKSPGENQKIVGKLPKNGGSTILEADNGTGWTKISSGDVTGYVSTQFLIIGKDASKIALDTAKQVATAKADGLRVREKPSVNSSELDTIAKGEELLVLNPLVVTYGEQYNKWVMVLFDSDSNENGVIGYVAKDFVDLSYSLPKASSMEELVYGTGVSSLRVDLINFAKQYLGYRYVWGGTSLKNGVDCSGFTQQVYKNFNVSIPRTSSSQGASGTRVSKNDIKPGDLVFYGTGSSINHVAIYIGNNKIIHASNRRDGIKISNMNYRTPIKYVRYIKN